MSIWPDPSRLAGAGDEARLEEAEPVAEVSDVDDEIGPAGRTRSPRPRPARRRGGHRGSSRSRPTPTRRCSWSRG